MMSFKVLIITVFLASAIYAEGQEVDSSGREETREKVRQCIRQTNALKECCSVQRPDPTKQDSSCKHHMEGLEGKTEKEKLGASRCFMDCMFRTKGLFKDGDFDKTKILEVAESWLTENNELDFLDISRISYANCVDKYEANKERWNNFEASITNVTGIPESMTSCSMMPIALHNCAMSNVLRNCPESKWTNTEHCNAMKANATSVSECMNLD